MERLPDNSGDARALAKNAVWNLAGQAVPLGAAAVAIPLVIAGLGIQRFGVLTLAWMVVGYFGLFDFGLGRALTKLLAEALGRGEESRAPSLAWTALTMMGAVGLAGAATAAVLSAWLVTRILRIPPALQGEALDAFRLLAVSIPFVIGTASLRGILEAFRRFDLVNLLRAPAGMLTYLGPLAALPFGGSLPLVVLILAAGRIALWAAHLWACLRVVPSLRRVAWDRRAARDLLSLGGWMTVSNVVGPVMTYMDRFVIGAVISMAAVAYYVTPYEMITRLWLVPAALAGALFPAVSAGLAVRRDRAADLFGRTVRILCLALFPVTLAAVAFASEGLGAWVGAEFARRSAAVLQWLAAGVFLNSLAQPAFVLLQGAGRADLTAKLHLAELPVYAAMLWYFLGAFGVAGAAVAWALRAAMDWLVLFILSARILPEARGAVRLALIWGAAPSLLFLGAAFLNPLSARLVCVGIVVAASALLLVDTLTPLRFVARVRRCVQGLCG